MTLKIQLLASLALLAACQGAIGEEKLVTFQVRNNSKMALHSDGLVLNCGETFHSKYGFTADISDQTVYKASTEIINKGETSHLIFDLNALSTDTLFEEPKCPPGLKRHLYIHYWQSNADFTYSLYYDYSPNLDIWYWYIPACEIDFYFTEPDPASPKGMVTLNQVKLTDRYLDKIKNPSYQNLECTRTDDHTITISDKI